MGLGSTLFYCTFLSLPCGQCGLSHSYTSPLFLIPAPPRCLICTSLSLFIVQSTWCLPPLHSPSPCPSCTTPRNPPNPPGPAPVSVPTGIGREGSTVPTRPSTAQLLCPWLQGVEVRESSASAAPELWLRTGWTCWRFPWFLSIGTSRALWGRTRGAVEHTSSIWRGEKTPLTAPSLLSVLCSGIIREHQHHHRGRRHQRYWQGHPGGWADCFGGVPWGHP